MQTPRTSTLLTLTTTALALALGPVQGAEKIKVLLIDGQNNHNWRATSPVLLDALRSTGKFEVDVSTSPGSAPRGPRRPRGTLSDAQKKAFEKQVAAYKKARDEHDAKIKSAWTKWRPQFDKYDVVLSNYNGQDWPQEVKDAFVKYVKNGGGVAIVHAANNSFGNWKEYNEIIGLGGWGGRSEKSGPYVYFKGDKFVYDKTPGRGGSHGSQHEFVVTVRDPNHPITKGMPTEWLHTKDELYDRLRGPAKNMTVLATAYSNPEVRGRGAHEPMIMVLNYGKGRVFHTPMGHADYSMKCVGFYNVLQRGCEWAATGKVTQALSKDFPSKNKISVASK